MEMNAIQVGAEGGLPGFAIGDLVVHPHHGVGRVVGKRRRRLIAGERDYLEIDMIDKSLTIMLPLESAPAVGLRPVAGAPEVRRIVAVLEDEPVSAPGRWASRERHYRDRLKGGDVLALASVVRDLAVRATETDLATTEQTLYAHSRMRLASELGCALGLDAEQAAAYIDAHITRPGRIEHARVAPDQTAPRGSG